MSGAPHVAQVGFYTDPARRRPGELLDAWPTLLDVAQAAQEGGARVSLIQTSSYTERLTRNGVGCYFLPYGEGSSGSGYAALGELLAELSPDLIHVHGLGFARDVEALAAREPDVPIVLQDHASGLPPFWRRVAWRRGLSHAAGLAFCAAAQARPFASAGLIHPHTRVYEIPESTSRFTPGDRAGARASTGVRGDPALLWVGHLNANKDPLTVLEGVSAATDLLPNLRLYCCFGVAPLLRAVEERIAGDRRLRERVELLGHVPHERIETLMRAADLFVLGSHKEGSGYSLIEALACGLMPVVTDIPSFRALTGAGTVGALWPCGDSRAFSNSLQAAWGRADAKMRGAVRTHFDRELSFAALGRKLVAMYRDVIERRGVSAPMLPPTEPRALGSS